MPELIRLDGLLAKTEVTYGLDSAPVVGTDGVRLARRMMSRLTVEYVWENDRRETASGSIIPVKAGLPKGRRVRYEVFWEAKGAGIDAAPEAAPLLIAGGLPEVDGTQMFDYGPPNANGTKGSATLHCYGNGKLFKLVGCRNRPTWPMLAGEHVVFGFSGFGFMLLEPSTVQLPAITYDSTDPIALVNSALQIGTWVPEWQSANYDPLGADMVTLTSGNVGPTGWTDGIVGFDVAELDPNFSITARVPTLAIYDPFADLKARTSRTLQISAGSVQFNRIKIPGANAAIRGAIRHGDADGYANYDLEYQVESTGLPMIRFD